MKTLEEIKKQVEIKLGFTCVGSQMNFAEELAKQYAKQCIKASLQKASNNVFNFTNQNQTIEESINNSNNIILL